MGRSQHGMALRYLGMDSQLPASIALLTGELLGFFVLILCAILVHEAGHVLAALLFGFRVHSIKVGPIQLRTPNSWSWTFSRSGFLLGHVRTQFRRIPGRWATPRCLALIAGGPVANILPGLLAAPFLRGETGAGNLAALFFLVSAFFGATQLLPFRVGATTSDGSKIIALLFSKKRREDLLFQLAFIARLQKIRELCRAGQIREALSRTDSLAHRLESIPEMQANLEFRERLSRLREGIQGQLPIGEFAGK